MSVSTSGERLERESTHPDGIIARPKAHLVSERSAGDAGVALRTALRLCFAEPHGGAGHVAQGAEGEARDEVVGIHKRCDQIFGELAQVRVERGSADKTLTLRAPNWGKREIVDGPALRLISLTVGRSNRRRRACPQEGRWSA